LRQPSAANAIQEEGQAKYVVASEQNELAALFPSIATQMRGTLSKLYLASAQLAPAAARERDPALDARAAQVDQSYYQLLRLVNSLSAAAYLTNDQPLPLRDQDVVALVSDLCERAAALAPLLELDLRFVCVPERHICAISGDALEQIVYHLLSNAFKFTPAGGVITVELRLAHGRVLLTVSDTGCGIPQERLETLFDRYLHSEQQDPPPHGLGLGLPLCRRLAEGQGGTLMAESRPGKGSRFTVSLPDRQLGSGVSDVPFDYSGGFNRTLLALADALPVKAFLLRSQD
jgi:signal transduction histidine kinase